jgi:pyruvate formate lyase activating enzyme
VRCDLCAHRCSILPGKAGVCQVRVNRGGELRTLVSDRLIAAHADPIEKKPLFHFLPGSRSFSVATMGCNFRCGFCQNWDISQRVREGGAVLGQEVSPSELLAAAAAAGCASFSFTYTEPTIFFELCERVGTAARAAGLKNVFVTNGYMTREAVQRATAFLDAANVDLKGFDDARYRKVCGAGLKGVLEGIDALLAAGVWLEVTTLVVPGVNDGEDELRRIARHLAGLGRDIPWHVSRFHPDYKMRDRGATPESSLVRACEIGREEGLRYVYIGNLPGGSMENTRCPNCGTMVARRLGFVLAALNLSDGRCGGCGSPIPGVWS